MIVISYATILFPRPHQSNKLQTMLAVVITSVNTPKTKIYSALKCEIKNKNNHYYRKLIQF